MSSKALFFVPVQKKYLSKWEYYQVDYDVLSQLFSEVIVCTSIWQVLRHFRKADLIYCWWWHQSMPVVLLAKIFSIKTYVTGAIHMYDLSGSPDFYSKGFLYKLSARISLALADYNLFISYDQCSQITSHLYVNNPIVVRSSLTKDPFFSCDSVLQERSAYKQKDDGSKKHQFLTVVWHMLDQYKRKGVFETLAALAILKETADFEFEWIIAGGNGDGVENLRSKITSLGLDDQVSIYLDVSPEEKKELFLKSDLYIQPSWCEGFGNAVLEAMSHGVPALVSRYTAQPEVVGSAGFIAMQVTSDSIFNSLKEFLEMDDEETSQMVRAVVDRVEKEFSFSTRLTALRKIFVNSNDQIIK
ncbi:MAG: glycosyltransferase family 4 protein [Gammaproteobacteria bacterium]